MVRLGPSFFLNRITRRTFLKTAGAATAGASLTGSFSSCKKTSSPNHSVHPHILLIMTDQHRGDGLGCMGNLAVKTPHLDAIARDGVVFTNAYSACPSCTPARSGLLTGLSPWHHGMLGYGRIAEQYKFEMPRMLRDSGYYTFGVGKMHFYPQKALHGFHGTLVDESGRVEQTDFVSDYRDWFKLAAPGLDPDATGIGWNEHRAGVYALDERLHPTRWTGETAVELIKNYKLDKPLFLKVSFAQPHSPYDPPQRFLDIYGEEDMPAPAVGDWARHFADYPMEKNAAFGDFGVNHAKKSRRAYYASITFIDEMIGRIVETLKKKQMYDNTLIIFTSDHGDMLGDHHHWRKTYAYEGSANIPFILKWPSSIKEKINTGASLPHPVELRDVLPTFLDAAGAEIPEEMDGASLLTLVREEQPKWRNYIDMEHATCYEKHNYWCALTDGDVKYIYFFSDGTEQLFDLNKDPGEIMELSTDPVYQEILLAWRERMIAHLLERGEGFVKDGQLQVRKETLLYSPCYPEK